MRRTILSKLLPALIFLASSCVTKKAAVIKAPVDPFPVTTTFGPAAPIEKKLTDLGSPSLIDSLQQRQIRFTTLSMKAKATVQMDGKDNDLTLNIRIRKDQAIWIFATATVAGVEVSRMLITPDSVKLVNKTEKQYLQKPFSYLSQFTGNGLSFGTLQALLTGSLPPGVMDHATITRNAAARLFSGDLDQLAYLITADASLNILKTDLKNKQSMQVLNALYSDFSVEQGQRLPNTVELRSSALTGPVSVSMKYSKITVNEPVDMPFTINKKFTEIN